MGGVSEGPTREVGVGAILAFDFALATVEGILVSGNVSVLRGTPQEARPRPVRKSIAGSSPIGETHRRQRMFQGLPRKGTPSASALRSECTGHEKRELSRASAADASFARSSDPSHVVTTQLRRGDPPKVARSKSVSRSGKPGESQEEPAPGSNERGVRGSPRVTASARKKRGSSEKEGRHGARPCEDRESSGLLPVRRSSCSNRQATSDLEYARQTRPKKGGQGRVNGGLGRSIPRR